MVASINLDSDYPTHPKVYRLIDLLGRSAEILPIRLWCWCAKHHGDGGVSSGLSTQEIETAMRWWGGPGKAVDALFQAGFLDKHAKHGHFVIHDWDERNPHAKVYHERAKKAATARWAKREKPPPVFDASSNASSNASSMLQASIKNAQIQYLNTSPRARVREPPAPDTVAEGSLASSSGIASPEKPMSLAPADVAEWAWFFHQRPRKDSLEDFTTAVVEFDRVGIAMERVVAYFANPERLATERLWACSKFFEAERRNGGKDKPKEPVEVKAKRLEDQNKKFKD